MDDTKSVEYMHTRIWHEEPEPDNPFAVRTALCHGYDVFTDILGKAGWIDMLYLLFRGEAPSAESACLLEALAVTLSNPGPRDPSVHAAMCAGVCGSTAASSLMAALAVGAGGLSGSRDVFLSMQAWVSCETNLDAWRAKFSSHAQGSVSIWPDMEHPPGFEPHAVRSATIVKQALVHFSRLCTGGHLAWLAANLEALEAAAGRPIAMSGIAAAVLHDLGFTPEQGEMLHLLLRLPGAAVHALEQREYGFRKFPFYEVELEDDPAKEQA